MLRVLHAAPDPDGPDPAQVPLADVINGRCRIAAALHDSVIQTLVAATYLTESGDATREETVELLRRATREVRSIMAQLSAPNAQSLPVSFDMLARHIATLHPVRVDLDIAADLPDVDHLTGYGLHRIAQEALENVAAHADADAATVRVRNTAHGIELNVVDDGCGFTGAELPQSGRGLAVMRLYAVACGGTLTVDSEAGRGTAVRAVLPAADPPG